MENYDYEHIGRLVDKAKDGDSNSFAELYVSTYARLYSFAEQYLKDKHLAQDAIQDAYILALKNLAKLKNSQLFISWLKQITFHVCFNMKAKQNRYDTAYIDPSSFEMESYKDHAPGPESLAVRKDYEQFLWKTVNALPSSEGTVIKMMYYDNMTIDEIVSITGMSRSTVKRRLNNGRDRLKRALKHREDRYV